MYLQAIKTDFVTTERNISHITFISTPSFALLACFLQFDWRDEDSWFLQAPCWRKEGIACLWTCWRLMRMTAASTWAAAFLPRWSSCSCRQACFSFACSPSEDSRRCFSTALPWETCRKHSEPGLVRFLQTNICQHLLCVYLDSCSNHLYEISSLKWLGPWVSLINLHQRPVKFLTGQCITAVFWTLYAEKQWKRYLFYIVSESKFSSRFPLTNLQSVVAVTNTVNFSLLAKHGLPRGCRHHSQVLLQNKEKCQWNLFQIFFLLNWSQTIVVWSTKVCNMLHFGLPADRSSLLSSSPGRCWRCSEQLSVWRWHWSASPWCSASGAVTVWLSTWTTLEPVYILQ